MKFTDIPSIAINTGYRPCVSWRGEVEDKLESWREQGLELNPDFQRGHVWTESQQIAYVEYMLQGGISGRDLYFNCSTWGGSYSTPIYLVDGKQRLTAALRFMNNEIPAYGYYLWQFEDRIPHDICFYFNMNNLKSRKEMLGWYVALNGGVAHTEEEINRVKALIEQEK